MTNKLGKDWYLWRKFIRLEGQLFHLQARQEIKTSKMYVEVYFLNYFLLNNSHFFLGY